MHPYTRADLADLPNYVPGKTIPGAIKLASNEVSAGPLPAAVEAITNASGGVHRYPDMEAGELVRQLATTFDTSSDNIAVGCGSVSLCQQLIQATCTDNDEVIFAWRSFEAYPIITQICGARQVRVPLTAAHELDLDAMASAITPATRLIFVCNPNNPTGTALRRDELERFLDAVPRDVLVVLDEAYREFVTDPEVPDGIELARTRDNVAVLRTFSKAYGLAGLRVGYCVAAAHVAEALRKVYVPFSVSGIAQEAAVASLASQREMRSRCAEVIEQRGRVRAELLANDYEVPESQANFVWLPLGRRTPAFNQHCLEHKVVVRAFAEDGARVTIGTAEENDVFLDAARKFALDH